MPETFNLPSPLQEVTFPPITDRGIRLLVKRDDLIHSEVSGNKWRKLKLNIEKLRQRGNSCLLTLGGAHSNHTAATAAAAEMYGLRSIGVIRGEDANMSNFTLSFARAKGMELYPISRQDYRRAREGELREEFHSQFGAFYFVPEGGANDLGRMGCMDIMKELGSAAADRVFVACGTGTTFCGMGLANLGQSMIYGVSALRGGAYLMEGVRSSLCDLLGVEAGEEILSRMRFLDNFHFGAYARITPELTEFMRSFFRYTGIRLDPIYTAKCAFAMKTLAEDAENDGLQVGGYDGETWVLVHSGGLQGIPAMEARYGLRFYEDC